MRGGRENKGSEKWKKEKSLKDLKFKFDFEFTSCSEVKAPVDSADALSIRSFNTLRTSGLVSGVGFFSTLQKQKNTSLKTGG